MHTLRRRNILEKLAGRVLSMPQMAETLDHISHAPSWARFSTFAGRDGAHALSAEGAARAQRTFRDAMVRPVAHVPLAERLHNFRRWKETGKLAPGAYWDPKGADIPLQHGAVRPTIERALRGEGSRGLFDYPFLIPGQTQKTYAGTYFAHGDGSGQGAQRAAAYGRRGDGAPAALTGAAQPASLTGSMPARYVVGSRGTNGEYMVPGMDISRLRNPVVHDI